MQIFIPKEAYEPETRVAVLPDTVAQLIKLGASVEVEPSLAASLDIEDSAYEAAGARLANDRNAALGSADIVLRLRKPSIEDVHLLKEGCIHISYMEPFQDNELVRAFAEKKVSAISMELIPRSTIAQKMDALSSQANLAGYTAVIIAANKLKQAFPMMMTPAGTLAPAKVLIIGAGVAGLQAIATAKRLGARVEAYDTRPVVEEQVKSLGARFLKIDIGDTGETKQGYAKELTEEQLQKQRDAMKKFCASADVVITTAQVFGRTAPRIITQEMIEAMKPGTVIVDMAVETGGNVEGSVVDQEVKIKGVTIVGTSNLPGKVPLHSSQMYSNNLGNLIKHFWDAEAKCFKLSLEDEILASAMVTHTGEVRNQQVADRLSA